MKNSVLNTTVSYYSSRSGKAFNRNLLEYLDDTLYEEKVTEIRKTTTKEERNKLKAKLPGITPTAICYPTRSAANVVRRTGLMVFDIDNLDAEKMETFRNIIIEIPYVAYFGLSVSGRGYWGLISISNPAKYEQHFDALELDFKEYGIEKPSFDVAVKDIAHFRYYSCDRHAYFNHNADTYDRIYAPPKRLEKQYVPATGKHAGMNLFDVYNLYGDIEGLLISHGWKYQSQYDKGTRRRYTRPGKNNGISADYCMERKLLYVFSSDPATGMNSAGKAYNHVAVFCQLECRNDMKLCAKKLREMILGKY